MKLTTYIRQHVLQRPDMYIGAIKATQQDHWILPLDKNTTLIEKQPIDFIPGLYKIFDEILVNAADNSRRDTSQTTIQVTIADDGTISIFNDGRGNFLNSYIYLIEGYPSSFTRSFLNTSLS